MRYINSYNELERVLNQTIEISMNRIGDKVSKLLKSYIQKNWYSNMHPEYYKRTKDVLNSITFKIEKKEKGYLATIYSDNSKVIAVKSTFPLPPGMPRFHHHMNIHGKDVSEWVIDMMNFGNNNSKLYSYQGVNFLRNTKQAMMSQSIHLRQLEIEFRKIGIKVGRY